MATRRSACTGTPADGAGVLVGAGIAVGAAPPAAVSDIPAGCASAVVAVGSAGAAAPADCAGAAVADCDWAAGAAAPPPDVCCSVGAPQASPAANARVSIPPTAARNVNTFFKIDPPRRPANRCRAGLRRRPGDATPPAQPLAGMYSKAAALSTKTAAFAAFPIRCGSVIPAQAGIYLKNAAARDVKRGGRPYPPPRLWANANAQRAPAFAKLGYAVRRPIMMAATPITAATMAMMSAMTPIELAPPVAPLSPGGPIAPSVPAAPCGPATP